MSPGRSVSIRRSPCGVMIRVPGVKQMMFSISLKLTTVPSSIVNVPESPPALSSVLVKVMSER